MGEFIFNKIPSSAIIEIVKKISSLVVEDNANRAHDEVERLLTQEGLWCIREYHVNDRGDGKPGRIDLFVINGDETIGIEIDDTIPRKKSVYKLISLGDSSL